MNRVEPVNSAGMNILASDNRVEGFVADDICTETEISPGCSVAEFHGSIEVKNILGPNYRVVRYVIRSDHRVVPMK
jgi:hypothetical protein